MFSGIGKSITRGADKVISKIDHAMAEAADSSLLAGLFANFKKEFSSAATSLNREVNQFSRTVNDKWEEHASSPLLDTFRNGNVIQLISRKSGRCVEIVMSPQGQLVLDALGTEGPAVYHAHWTVMNEGKNIVRLHNNTNFLALRDGMVSVANYPNPQMAGYETRFRLHQMSSTHISLEAADDKERGRHLGFLENGQLKSSLATGREIDGQFGIRVIYAAPRPQAPTTVVVNQAGGRSGVTVVTPGQQIKQPGQQTVIVNQGARLGSGGTTVIQAPQGAAPGQPTTVVLNNQGRGGRGAVTTTVIHAPRQQQQAQAPPPQPQMQPGPYPQQMPAAQAGGYPAAQAGGYPAAQAAGAYPAQPPPVYPAGAPPAYPASESLYPSISSSAPPAKQ